MTHSCAMVIQGPPSSSALTLVAGRLILPGTSPWTPDTRPPARLLPVTHSSRALSSLLEEPVTSPSRVISYVLPTVLMRRHYPADAGAVTPQ